MGVDQDEAQAAKGIPDDEGAALPADFLHRTTLLLGRRAVGAMRAKTVAVAGCGGAGGAAAILLARMGVGAFVLADPGVFDPPDINRQWAAATSTLGRNKAEVYAEILRDINPAVRVRASADGVTEDTVTDIVADADVLVDCLDLKVPLPLRLRVYQEAQRRGLYCVSAPIIGTGTLLMMASPTGMPLDGLVRGIVEHGLANSQLPAGCRSYFFPDNVDALERHIAKGMAASLAIAPALAGAFIATELLTVLLRDVLPHWRPPVTLPEVLVVEPLRSSCAVLPYTKLFPELASVPGVRSPSATEAGPAPDEQQRREQMRAVGYNTVALPKDAVAVDLLTDSWAEVPVAAEENDDAVSTLDEVEAALKALFPYAHVEPVCRGRFAEALLTEALVRPGSRVLTNAHFPTAQYHLGARGAKVVYVGPSQALRSSPSSPPTSGTADVDFSALERELASGEVSTVYLELCNNALGGLPVSTACLRQVHQMARARRALVVLDASRAYTNAAQLAVSAAEGQAVFLQETVAELCGSSDACTASLTKDFASPVGGMVAVNDAGLAQRLRQLARLLYGVALPPRDLGHLRRSLHLGSALAARVQRTRLLAERLSELGVPAIHSPGSHAVFVDARAFLPHLPAEARPDVALASELFAINGVRAAYNLLCPEQRAAGIAMVRFAVRMASHSRDDLEAVWHAFRQLIPRRHEVRGVRAVPTAEDRPERFELV